MKTSNELTAVEAETLAFIAEHVAKHGYSPTVAEMAKAAGVFETAVADRCARLLRKGAITKTPGIARSIRPVTPFQLPQPE